MVHTISDNRTIGPFLGRTHIAYFTMEMAIRPEMHTYSGGLGVLAGDTARACADLEVPSVFVTLMSRDGYLRQEIDAQGRQIDHPDPWNVADYCVPLRAKVAILICGREVWVRPWLYAIKSPLGTAIPVILLDTDLHENHEADRAITARLYGGDSAYRFKQEIVLGICGVRILSALGFQIQTYHLNEGHAALLPLDLLRRFALPKDQTQEGELGYDVGRVRDLCIFTTHTPVEAGHDKFDYTLVQDLLGDYFDIEKLRKLAGADSLNMTLLAMKLCGYVNGVAQRHARTTQRMFPGYRIRSITNGVHLPTWVTPQMSALLNTHYPSWALEPETLGQVDQLPGEAVWDVHQSAKAELIDLVAQKCDLKMSLDQPILGYARRMTAYKRPELVFSDLERLAKLCHQYPFQIVLAGKAHPRDAPGKAHIEAIYRHIAALKGRVPIAFVPDYDMTIAKTLVPGVDIWLNTPVPPLEASGTSGMKAALNGALNLSILDGWWIEGCIEGVTGWAIGKDEETVLHEGTAEALYDKLEQTVLPLYYNDRDGWIAMMKCAISRIGAYFNTQRMMRRYVAEAYVR